MVHVPLCVSDKFSGKSGAGLFGDVVMEVDWSVGQILDAIKRNGIDDNTLVIFTSDNGPWLNYGNHAGSAGPLREGKGTMWEGGYREPCVMRWPGKIPAGTKCDEFAVTIDLFPTIAQADRRRTADRSHDRRQGHLAADGRRSRAHRVRTTRFTATTVASCAPCAIGAGSSSFRTSIAASTASPAGRDGNAEAYKQLKTGKALYDLRTTSAKRPTSRPSIPTIVARLEQAAEKARAALGDTLTGRKGSEVRPAGKLPKTKYIAVRRNCTATAASGLPKMPQAL